MANGASPTAASSIQRVMRSLIARPGPASLRFRDLIDFGQNQRRVVFESIFHRFKITLRILSRAVLEAQVAQIVVNGVAALQQLVQFRAVWRQIRSIRLDEKNEQRRGQGERQARAYDGPIPGGNS